VNPAVTLFPGRAGPWKGFARVWVVLVCFVAASAATTWLAGKVGERL
jgi:hypothetical protein